MADLVDICGLPMTVGDVRPLYQTASDLAFTASFAAPTDGFYPDVKRTVDSALAAIAHLPSSTLVDAALPDAATLCKLITSLWGRTASLRATQVASLRASLALMTSVLRQKITLAMKQAGKPEQPGFVPPPPPPPTPTLKLKTWVWWVFGLSAVGAIVYAMKRRG